MSPEINALLDQFSRENNFRILHACETGSRGWGFASPDSDFDIRFIYAYPRDKYLSISAPKDTITRMIHTEEILDYNGWDIRKVLHHIRNSNATMFEWLQSPIIYQTIPNFKSDLWKLANLYFEPRSGAHHYLGICHNTIKSAISNDVIKIKKYFYILRPILAAKWCVENQTPPPIRFHDLLPLLHGKEQVRAAIMHLLKEKEVAVEGQIIQLNPVLQDFINSSIEEVHETARAMPSGKQTDDTLLNEFFRQTIQ